MNPVGEHHLLDMVKRYGRHLWIGNHPPFEFDNLLLQGCTNFRAPASLHRRFDVVWSHETDIASLSALALPLYLDELVRFVGEEGRIVFRYTQSAEVTLVHLKRHFGRHPMLDAEVEYETQDKAGVLNTVFRVRRKHVDAYASDLWTFAVLTVGARKANVVEYLRSIRAQDPERRHEILICGPRADEYEPYGPRYNDRPYSTQFVDICAKKNDLAELAKHPNLLIVHDRYKLDDNFFAGFEDYGYDFDFLSVRQHYECGTEFPAYATLSKEAHSFVWHAPIALADTNRVYPLSFLNGGLLAFKTHALRQLTFNELLFWNQAEDCDLSRWMMDHSLPPRFNSFSSATVLGLKPSYTKGFRPEHPPVRRPAREEPVEEPKPEVPGLAKRARTAVARPYRTVRRGAARNFRKLAALGLLTGLAMQAAILYFLINGRDR